MRCGLTLGIALSLCAAQDKATPTPSALAERSYDPDLLSFDELVALASTAKPEADLGMRLNALLNTPFLHQGRQPRPSSPGGRA